MKAILLCSLLLGCGSYPDAKVTASDGHPEMNGAPEHIHPMKGAKPSSPGSSNPLMTFHGGQVLQTNQTMAVFWGSEWNTSSFAGDKISGLDAFFQGFGGTTYANTGSEYATTSTSTYLGHIIDSSAAPRRALKTSDAVAAVCRLTANNPLSNAVYFLYTSTGAGQVNYCAWHSWGTCSNGKLVQVAYMPNITGISGCDPGDHSTGHSEGLAALANVTAHELMEAVTDPRGTGWYDSSGQENGDKCAWSFPPVLSSFTNGSQWKLQMEWSNSAYKSSSGLPNLSGQKGCIY